MENNYNDKEYLGLTLEILESKKEEIESKIRSHKDSMRKSRIVNIAGVAYASACGLIASPSAALATLAIGVPVALGLELSNLSNHIDLVTDEVKINSEMIMKRHK